LMRQLGHLMQGSERAFIMQNAVFCAFRSPWDQLAMQNARLSSDREYDKPPRKTCLPSPRRDVCTFLECRQSGPDRSCHFGHGRQVFLGSLGRVVC
jgi:hypothetical protein